MAGECELQLTGATKRYGPTVALRECSIDLRRGEVLGLVGENGAGKSTLIGILNGTVTPDSGTLLVRGAPAELGSPHRLADAGIATVFQEQNLVGTLPVYENLFLGREEVFIRRGWLRRQAMKRRAGAILAELGIAIPPDARCDDLRFGERQMIEIGKAFAHAILSDARPIILLDEPTSALTDGEAEILFERIAQWRHRASFLFVSHHLEDVLAVSDRLVVLKDGQGIDERLAEGVTEGELHELMVGRKRDREYYKENLQLVLDDASPVLEVRELTCEPYFRDVSLSVAPGEIIGVAGVIGSGKSDLGLALAGGLRPEIGEILVSGRAVRLRSVAAALGEGIAYVPPERASEGVVPYLSVVWNLSLAGLNHMRLAQLPLIDTRREARMADEMVERLNIKTPSRRASISSLSGGNQQKVVLGKCLATRPRILVLDDPTRGIDVGAKEELYGLIRDLAAQGVAVVLVSDNMHEIIGMSNRIVIMKDGEVQAEVSAPTHGKPSEERLVRDMV